MDRLAEEDKLLNEEALAGVQLYFSGDNKGYFADVASIFVRFSENAEQTDSAVRAGAPRANRRG